MPSTITQQAWFARALGLQLREIEVMGAYSMEIGDRWTPQTIWPSGRTRKRPSTPSTPCCGPSSPGQ